jgi:hypothetical protein
MSLPSPLTQLNPHRFPHKNFIPKLLASLLIFSCLSPFIQALGHSTEIKTQHVQMGVGSTLFFPTHQVVGLQLPGESFKHWSSEGKLWIQALKKGAYGIVKLRNSLAEVQVLSVRQMRTHSLLTEVCQDMGFCQVLTQKGEIKLKGRLRSWEGFKALATRCLESECDYSNELVVPDFQKTKLIQWLEHQFLKGVKARPAFHFQSSWIAEVQKGALEEPLQTTLQSLGFKIKMAEQVLTIDRAIKIQVLFAELSIQRLQALGLSLPQEISGQVLPQGTLDPIQLKLLLSAQKGLGQALASPSLVVKSGATGEFTVGGEFPVVSRGAFQGQSVEWKPYGISLKVAPLIDSSGRMNLKIETGVSQLDLAASFEGIPSIKQNLVKTGFDLSDSRTIMLSGLIRQEQARAAQGWPGLIDLPIIGRLLSSEDFRKNQSELVILLKPEVLDL